ncbi:MAG: suppressor of fused domain protein [Actinomycetota bacterium]|nr:suppressor of fused domain protein [Actinomycetota bacterium]
MTSVLGAQSGRAGVSFLGSEQVEVLRFFAADVIRYVTLGMARYAMADPGSELVAQHGPRAELVLSVREARDSVLRRLAVLAASPVVEGVVVTAGAGLDLGEPLWDGSRFTAVLVGEPGGLVPDLPLDGDEPVRFLPLLPMTPNEAAWKRVHGAAALEERWLAQEIDLRDPLRPEVSLR